MISAAFGFAMLGTSPVWAEAIAFAGFSLAHSAGDLHARLTNEGYDCDVGPGLVICIGPQGEIVTAASTVSSGLDMLAVTCTALGSCDWSIDETKMMLGAALQPAIELAFAIPPGGGPLSSCGVGPDGDSICLGPDRTVTFFSSALGPPKLQ